MREKLLFNFNPKSSSQTQCKSKKKTIHEHMANNLVYILWENDFKIES